MELIFNEGLPTTFSGSLHDPFDRELVKRNALDKVDWFVEQNKMTETQAVNLKQIINGDSLDDLMCGLSIVNNIC